MKHLCVITLVLLCVLPVLMWPTEESLHPVTAALLVEEGFEVTGRHRRAVRSAPTAAGSGSRTTSTKHSAPVNHKRSSTTHQKGKKLTPDHLSQIKNDKKTKKNRPSNSGKKYIAHRHQQKKQRYSLKAKERQLDKTSQLRQ